MIEGKHTVSIFNNPSSSLPSPQTIGVAIGTACAMEELMQRLEGPRCLFLEDTCGNALEVMSLRGTECWSGLVEVVVDKGVV